MTQPPLHIAGDDDDNDEDFLLSAFLFDSDTEENANDDLSNHSKTTVQNNEECTLKHVMEQIKGYQWNTKDTEGNKEQLEKNLIHRHSLIVTYMGTMAQCRGNNGNVLRNAGAIDALMHLLLQCQSLLRKKSVVYESAVQITSSSFASLRDLACGNALNRTAIGSFDTENSNGIQIIVWYIQRCLTINNTAMNKMELRLFTNALGVIRNITHSHSHNCIQLHKYGLTNVLITWLVQQCSCNGNKLPDASQPLREVCYRMAGSLINMAEKCTPCAKQCSFNNDLLWILMESWGGIDKTQIVLHLGLQAIFQQYNLLQTNQTTSNTNLEKTIASILSKECMRKQLAQTREQQRKQNRNK